MNKKRINQATDGCEPLSCDPSGVSDQRDEIRRGIYPTDREFFKVWRRGATLENKRQRNSRNGAFKRRFVTRCIAEAYRGLKATATFGRSLCDLKGVAARFCENLGSQGSYRTEGNRTLKRTEVRAPRRGFQSFGRLSALLLVLVALLCAAGCISKRIVWSPDGKQAVVLGDEGLFLSDADGNVSPLLVPAVSGVAWFQDGTKLALAKTEKFERWSDLQQNLTADQQQEIEQSAQNLLRKVKAGMVWDQVASEVKSEDNLVDGQLNAALLCLRDQYGSQLTEKLSSILDSLKEARAEASSLYIGVIQTNQITLGRRLATETAYIWEIRVAPGGASIAYATFPDNGRQTSKIVALPASGAGSPKILAKEAGSYPDWSPDGKSLLYIQAVGTPHGKDELRLGALTRHGILNDSGRWEVSPSPESLVGVLFSEGAKVRCLSDGRIIFWSVEVHLPATRLDMPQRHQLFVYDPLRMASVTPLIPRGVEQQLPEALVYFEVSPDEKRIAIGDDKGRVFVFTIATGNVQTVQSIEDNLRTVPVWRSTDELTFIVPNVAQDGGAPSRSEVALWTPKQTRFLSKQWPENLRKGLLND